jgi:hypothetical protein
MSTRPGTQSPIRALSSCTPMEVFVISSVPLFLRGTSTSRAPLHAEARPSVVPRSRRGSRRVTGGSSLLRAQRPPSDLRRRCRRLPCSEVFLLGVRRVSPVPIQPFPTCCRPYPAGTVRGPQPVLSADDVAFARTRGARLPGFVLTGLARRSMPAARRVAPRPRVGFVRGTSRSAFATASAPPLLHGFWFLPRWGFHPWGCISFFFLSGHAAHEGRPRKTGDGRRDAACRTWDELGERGTRAISDIRRGLSSAGS